MIYTLLFFFTSYLHIQIQLGYPGLSLIIMNIVRFKFDHLTCILIPAVLMILFLLNKSNLTRKFKFGDDFIFISSFLVTYEKFILTLN